MALLFRKNPIDPDRFLRREHNNFDLFRIVGAGMVIFSHTYYIAWGDFMLEPLVVQTQGRISVGSIFLYIFFVLSGFLVTRSFIYSESVVSYVKKRLLRILPGLIAVVLLTMFVIGPLFNSLSPQEYFTEIHTWKYLKNITMYRLQYDLPGIFPNNPDFGTANSNFWTIALEFTWYMLVIVMGLALAFRYRWPLIPLFLGLFISFGLWGDVFDNVRIPILAQELKPLFRVGLYFLAGSILYLYRAWFLRLNPQLLLLIVPGWFLTVWFGYTDWTSPIFIPLITLLVATLHLPFVQRMARYGDPSYGVYIWGIPVQQMVVALLGTNWFVAFFVAVPVAYAFGYASWHFIEKPALRWKNRKIFGLI